ncbi:hypothetical protein [Nocardia cyriacigeorgica]|uniref:hypothetical protein n=1 Tax=Nocardia cyriacigeorgica TaxID=135487 RepID=UPI002456F729|nr:hypothetical protein [Nocardia cyriacigeorgica]
MFFAGARGARPPATVEAVTYSDVPVVLGVALLTAAIYLTVTVLVDIAYLWIDPRLREATP